MGIVTWSKRALNLLTANNTWTGTNDFKTATLEQETASNGAKLTHSYVTENLTLNTGSTTTDTTIDIPSNSLLLHLVYRVTTTITTAANYSIGDPTTSNRFVDTSTSLTSGNTGVGARHLEGSRSTDASGPVQGGSTAKIRVTTNVNPGAGAIRLTLFYIKMTPPTS